MLYQKFLPVAIMLGAMVSCSSKEEFVEPDPLPDESSALVNQFGWGMLRQFSDEGMQNIAFSPASIRGAFSPIQVGAAGNTLVELDNVFGPGDIFERFCDQYSRSGNGVSLVNGVVVDKRIPLSPAYVGKFKEGQIREADFTGNPEGEVEQVNKWIEKHTKGMIKDMLPANSFKNPLMAMVSLNATSFDAKWITPFDKDNTKPRIFHAEGGDSNVPMMSDEVTAYHVKGPQDSDLVALGCLNENKEPGSVVFVAVMPKEGQTLKEFISQTDWDSIAASLPAPADTGKDMDLIFPKFEIKSPLLNLTDNIKKQGINDLFDENEADLSNMTGKQELYVEKVLHQCVIKIFEEGAQAAAATTVDIIPSSIVWPLEFNRPFVWMVYDKKQKLVLFAGTFTKPTGTL